MPFVSEHLDERDAACLLKVNPKNGDNFMNESMCRCKAHSSVPCLLWEWQHTFGILMTGAGRTESGERWD